MKHSARRLGSTLSLAALLPLAAFASALPRRHAKIAADVAAAGPSKSLRLIVQYRTDPDAQQSDRLSSLGAQIRARLHSIHAVAATLQQDQVEQLAEDPNVAYISLDRPVHARQVSVTAAEYTAEPINAPQVWQRGYVGTNVGIAVIDSGITPVPDLGSASSLLAGLLPGFFHPVNSNSGRIVYSENFVPGESDALDHFGHGTHVAGLIAGNGAQSTGFQFYRTFYGAAPNANLINLRVLDENGNGTDSAVIAAIERAIALKNTYNIRVINLSLGRPVWESYTQDPLCQAVEQAWKAGIVVVAAAGNDGRDLALNPEGYGTIEAPANDPYAITVGAMRTMETPSLKDDLIASYSSKGPSFVDHIVKPDIVAPGNLVTSLQFSNDPLAQDNPSFITRMSFYQYGNNQAASPNYFPMSGTSMAAGVVSGAVADLVQAMPGLTPDQVKAVLMRTANQSYFPQTSSVTDPDSGNVYKANYDVFTVGAGYLDVNAAISFGLANARSLPSGTAMSPTAVYDMTTGNTTLVNDPGSLWNSTILWGASNIYGTNAVSAQHQVGSASTILWGADDPEGFTILWGANAVWNSSTPEAATILWGADDPSSSSTILWGANTVGSSRTILWGAAAPSVF